MVPPAHAQPVFWVSVVTGVVGGRGSHKYGEILILLPGPKANINT